MSMMLTVTEAAQLLGQSARTIRARLARGELKGRKDGSRWLIPRDVLPLPEAEHRRLQAVAESVRQAVEGELPSRVTSDRRRRSVLDEAPFRAAHRLHTALAAAEHPAASRAEALLVHLAVGWNEFHPARKLDAFGEARSTAAHLLIQLLLGHPVPPGEPVRGWLEVIEQEVLPAVAGWSRRAEDQLSAPRWRR